MSSTSSCSEISIDDIQTRSQPGVCLRYMLFLVVQTDRVFFFVVVVQQNTQRNEFF